MTIHTTPPSGVRQEAFDAIPVWLQQRTDIGGNAKRLYGALSSAQRMNWQPTYAELADRLGASARSIVRWVQQLAVAGLIAVKRRGQGLANLLTVLALVTSGADRAAKAAVSGWQRAATSPFKRSYEKKPGYTDAPRDYRETRAPSGRDFLETRRGRLEQARP